MHRCQSEISHEVHGMVCHTSVRLGPRQDKNVFATTSDEIHNDLRNKSIYDVRCLLVFI